MKPISEFSSHDSYNFFSLATYQVKRSHTTRFSYLNHHITTHKNKGKKKMTEAYHRRGNGIERGRSIENGWSWVRPSFNQNLKIEAKGHIGIPQKKEENTEKLNITKRKQRKKPGLEHRHSGLSKVELSRSSDEREPQVLELSDPLVKPLWISAFLAKGVEGVAAWIATGPPSFAPRKCRS